MNSFGYCSLSILQPATSDAQASLWFVNSDRMRALFDSLWSAVTGHRFVLAATCSSRFNRPVHGNAASSRREQSADKSARSKREPARLSAFRSFFHAPMGQQIHFCTTDDNVRIAYARSAKGRRCESGKLAQRRRSRKASFARLSSAT